MQCRNERVWLRKDNPINRGNTWSQAILVDKFSVLFLLIELELNINDLSESYGWLGDVAPVIDHDSNRMPNETEQKPEEDIVELWLLEIRFQHVLNPNQRHIAHHRSESEEVVHFEGKCNNQLMEDGWNKENSEIAYHAIDISSSHWVVDMTECPRVDRNIPFFPILLKRVWVPPVSVELAISEVKQLSDDVEKAVEEGVKHQYPHTYILHLQSKYFFYNVPGIQVIQRSDSASCDWKHALLNQEEHQHCRYCQLNGTLDYKRGTTLLGSWVPHLETQSRSQ